MPGRELQSSNLASESPVLGSLKSHKILPRRNLNLGEESNGHIYTRTQSPRRSINAPAYTTSDRIKSWMGEPTRIHPSVGPPLTPPLNLNDSFKSWIDDTTLRNRDFSGSSNQNADKTLISQNSPPTPETTPPKIKAKVSAQASIGSSKNVSDSRTQSFRTAHENFSSESYDQTPESPSLHLSRQMWLKDTGITNYGNIGLGLGLESEYDIPTPRRKPSETKANTDDFIAFDGVWGGSTPGQIHDQLQQRMLKVNTENTPLVDADEHSRSSTPMPLTPINHEPQRFSNGFWREELRRRSSPELATEKSVEQAAPPLGDQLKLLDTEFKDLSNKRISQASTNSTVVAAMVYDSPPQRQRTLRHTGRILNPNTSRSSEKRSNRGSVDSGHRSLRRGNPKLQSHEESLRQSFVAGKQRNEKDAYSQIGAPMPLTVIPDRRSSLRSSSASSKPFSKTFSAASQHISSRPTTAPEEAVSYFDMPHRDYRRTVSVVIQQVRPLDKDEKLMQDLTPPTANQTSPPSLTTSSALSRKTSVTSGVTKHQQTPATPSVQQSLSVSDSDAQPAHNISDPTITGDWSAFRPRSTMVTPFSLRSAHSSTPGTLEVNEATALSIHPHTNKSILVIQEIANTDSSKPREQSAIIAGNASIAIPAALTPIIHQKPISRRATDSPLQNPRDPPQPPDFIKIIPPTPANVPASSDDARQPYALTKPNRISAPLASIRRTLSARRYSDALKAPLARSLFPKHSGDGQRFSFVEGDERESRLHPSWRPRRDSHKNSLDNDSESEFGNDGVLAAEQPFDRSRPQRTLSLTNRIAGTFRRTSLRLPHRASTTSEKLQTSSQALPYEIADDAVKRPEHKTGRWNGSLKLPGGHRLRRSSTGSWSSQPRYHFIYPSRGDEAPRNGHSVPGQDYPVQFVGFRSILDRLEKRREMKEEGKREARRDWLKGQIDYVGPENEGWKRNGMVVGADDDDEWRV